MSGADGPGRAAGLVAAALAVMAGVVFAVNPARYGAPGVAAGVGLIALGLLGAVRLFRGGG